MIYMWMYIDDDDDATNCGTVVPTSDPPSMCYVLPRPSKNLCTRSPKIESFSKIEKIDRRGGYQLLSFSRFSISSHLFSLYRQEKRKCRPSKKILKVDQSVLQLSSFHSSTTRLHHGLRQLHLYFPPGYCCRTSRLLSSPPF